MKTISGEIFPADGFYILNEIGKHADYGDDNEYAENDF